MKRTLIWVAGLLFCGAAWAQAPLATQAPQGEARKADHDALRAVLAKSAEALTTRNLELLTPLVASGFTVITVDNQKLAGLDAFRKYYGALFDGPDAKLTKLEAKPTADELTRFLNDTTGIAYGTSEDSYHFKDGDTRVMKSRWSAVVQKDGEAWKLASVHFSASVADNPVVEGVKSYAMKLAAGGGFIGLVVGMLLMLAMRRKPS